MKNSEFDKLENNLKRMFKFAVAFIAVALFATLAVWGTVAYLAVTKGPETFHRAERVVDAYANKLERENNNQKSE